MDAYSFRVNIGILSLGWSQQHPGKISRLDWLKIGPELGSKFFERRPSKDFAEVVTAIKDYFNKGKPLPDLENRLDLSQVSDFQRRVYTASLKIPHGETRTYADLARSLASPKIPAARAVGQALRKNPIPVIIPCHRIVSQGSLGGFMGMTDPGLPELRLKRWMLDHESRFLNPVFSFVPEPGIEHYFCA